MNNLIVFPIIIPAITAIILIFIGKNAILKRIVALFGTLLTLAISTILLFQVHQNGPIHLELGNWPVPYAISLMSDGLSILLVTTSTLITLLIIFYSYQSIGIDRERYYYYASVMFMLTGINGAFTTGDIFNLFVFFEVFLMSSYVLMIIGGTKIQLQESTKYILINVTSSAFFVLAIGMLYAVVGSLQMADIAQKIKDVDPTIVSIIAILFILVFATKAGMFPLYFWLPSAYYAPPMPILAFFGALLTKVGVYAIMRTYSLFFSTSNDITFNILLILSVLTIIFGCIGAIAYYDMKKIIIYNITIAVGVILLGAILLTKDGSIGAIYYLIHDMIIKASLFMLIGIIIKITNQTDMRKISGLIKSYPLLGWTYFIAALSLAGIPPLSGFYGKMYIVKSLFNTQHVFSAILVLISSLVVLISVIRIFLYVFFRESHMDYPKVTIHKMLISSILMTLTAVLFGLFAGELYPFVESAAKSLYQPDYYIHHAGVK